MKQSMNKSTNKLNITNLIILILLIVLIIVLYKKYYSEKSGFIVERKDIIGNLLHTQRLNTANLQITFNESYRIVGFILKNTLGTDDNTFKFKFNNSFLRIEGQDDLKANELYDISSMNIVAKSIIIGNKKSPSNIFIYGLPLDNKLEPANYNNSKLLTEGAVLNSTGGYNFPSDYLINYIVLRNTRRSISSENIKIQYNNSYQEDMKQIRGLKEFDNKFAQNSERIYLNDNYLVKSLNFTGINNGTSIDFYGAIPTEKDLIEYRVKTEIQDDANAVIVDNAKCPAMNRIIETQSLINDMCNTLLEKDKMRNYKSIYEKQKKYLRILKSQNDQISNLEYKLKNLMDETNMSTDVQLQGDYRKIKDELATLTAKHSDVMENISVINTAIKEIEESNTGENPLADEL